MSELERTFETLCRFYDLPPHKREYLFAKPRQFRFDFAWPERRVAVECEGGVWTGGAHGRGSGIARDIAKYNLAATLGWRVLRCTSTMLGDDPVRFMEMLKKELKEEGNGASES